MCRRCDLLQQYVAKARCSYTNNDHYSKAYKLFQPLKEFVDEWDLQLLSTADSHFRIGEGAGELDFLVNKYKQKYHIEEKV